MLKQIKSFFKKYNDMAHAVDYLSNHMRYHLMNIHKLSRNGEPYAMFGREQLHFLVTSRISGLTDNQVKRVISLALKNIIANIKVDFMITKTAIYIVLL